MAYYTHTHYKTHQRVLMALLIITAAAGMHSVLASSDGQAPPSARQKITTPPVTAAVTKADSKPISTLPSGWSEVKTLPGTDGSGKNKTVAVAPVVATGSAAQAVNTGRIMNAALFGDSQWPALYALWNRESGWNPAARNRFSGACGIPQALPCAKISDQSVEGQIGWGLQYIKGRYGTPSNAWQFWVSHGWY